MAKKTSNADKKIVINMAPQVIVKSLNRGKSDIKTWRDALRSAENVQNPRRKDLYTLYSEILLDGHLQAVIQKRKYAVLNTRIEFIKTGETANNENVQVLLEKPWFYDLIDYIMDARFLGHTLVEFEMGDDGLIKESVLIERRNVSPERGLVLFNESDTTGIPFREPPYSYFTLEAGKRKDFGLLLQAAQYVIYKRGGFGDWAQYAEIFGMPFREATYDGHDEVTRKKLEEAMANMGSAGYVVLPNGSTIRIHPSGAGTGGEVVYKGLKEACNAELSVLILGNTMTTEDGSSLSQAEVHADSEHEINVADRRWVEFILNEDLRPILVNMGYKEFENGSFKFDDSEPIDVIIDRDTKIQNLIASASGGTKGIDPEELAKKYNVTLVDMPKPLGFGGGPQGKK